MSKVIVVKIWKQPIGIEVIQSLNVAPNTNVVKGGVLIRAATNLGCGSGGVPMGRNLNGSLGLPTTTTGVVGTS